MDMNKTKKFTCSGSKNGTRVESGLGIVRRQGRIVALLFFLLLFTPIPWYCLPLMEQSAKLAGDT